MIYVAPGASFQAVASDAPTGLTGTIGVRVVNNETGATVIARTTAGISEAIAGSGLYIAHLTAPSTPGSYTVVWDPGGALEPSKIATDELLVTTTPAIGGAVGTNSLVDDLVAAILVQGQFDVEQSVALGWLDQRHRLMCTRTKCLRKKVGIGPTVAGQTSYALPNEVLEIRELLVSSPTVPEATLGVPYGQGLATDIAQGALGYIWLGGLYLRAGGGIFARDESGAGADLVALFPTPTESGLAITLRAVCRPAKLAMGNLLATPPEYDDALIEGAVATGLARVEGRTDLATTGEQKFSSACAELLAETNRRFRGAGPRRIRVAGINY